MRLTINLEDDNYALAKSMARESDCSISQAVNRLLRRSFEPGQRERKPAEKRRKDGLPVVKGKTPFSSDDVYRIERDSS